MSDAPLRVKYALSTFYDASLDINKQASMCLSETGRNIAANRT